MLPAERSGRILGALLVEERPRTIRGAACMSQPAAGRSFWFCSFGVRLGLLAGGWWVPVLAGCAGQAERPGRGGRGRAWFSRRGRGRLC